MTAMAVFVGRSLRHAVRDVESLLMAIVLPAMLMLLFTWVFGGALDPSGGYIDTVVPGIMLTCAGFGAASTAVAVSRDRATGLMDRFRTMPVPAVGLVVGHVTASLAKNLVSTGVVVLVALALGFRPTAGPLAWLAVAGLVAAWILAITSLFAAIGLASGSPDAASGYGFALLFLPYLSSAFVPVATMPEWLQPIAAHQPVTPVVDTMRALLLGGEGGAAGSGAGGAPWLVALAWCAGITAGSLAWAAWLWRRRTARR